MRALAVTLGVHPSAMSPSNFKLGKAARHEAARQLSVPLSFLDDRPRWPDDLPVELGPVWQAVDTVRQRANHATRGWHLDAAVLALSVRADDDALTTEALRQLHHRATRRLATPHAAHLTLAQWSAVLDVLVDSALADAADLRDPRYRLASQLQSAVFDQT